MKGKTTEMGKVQSALPPYVDLRSFKTILYEFCILIQPSPTLMLPTWLYSKATDNNRKLRWQYKSTQGKIALSLVDICTLY